MRREVFPLELAKKDVFLEMSEKQWKINTL